MIASRGLEVPTAALPDQTMLVRDQPPRRPAPARPRTVPTADPSPDRSMPSATLLGRVVHAEVLKLISLRSAMVALGLAAFFIVAFGAVMTAGVAFDVGPPTEEADAEGMPLDAPMGGIQIAIYAVAALGVLAVSGEYSTRTIRSTLAAVPRRGVLVTGKAIAVAAVTVAATLPATVLAHVIGRSLLVVGGASPAVPLGDAVRVVVGASLYLAVVALVGSGLAWLLRSTAGALAALVGLLLIVPAFAPLLPEELGHRLAPLLPDAGAAVFQSAPVIAPWPGLAVFIAYGVVLLAAGTALITRRDS